MVEINEQDQGVAAPSEPPLSHGYAAEPVPVSGKAGIANAGHTPGPWRIRENPRNDQETCDLSICGDIWVLADITGPQYAHQYPNAVLMAAAPSMKEALSFYANPNNWSVDGTFFPASPHSEFRPDAGDTARAALSKANQP